MLLHRHLSEFSVEHFITFYHHFITLSGKETEIDGGY